MKAVGMDMRINGLPVRSIEMRREEMEDPTTFPMLSYIPVGPIRVSVLVDEDSPLRLLKPYEKVEVTWPGGGAKGLVEEVKVYGR